MPKKGQPHTGKGAKGILRPQIWLSGPDEFRHSMYTPWMRSKAQANFRGEGWDLSFEEFFNMWKDCWHQRGRQPDSLCMSRKDPDLAWDKDNAIIITRIEHLQKQGQSRTGKRKKPTYYKVKK